MNSLFHPRQGSAQPLPGGFIRLAVLLLAVAVARSSVAGGNALELRDGYFWDPVRAEYFVARGIAYQTWNPPVFANQSFEQIEYDLREFKKLHTNSVRAEFVWSQVEVQNNVFDWSKPDFLVQKAEELELKLFLIIGFQYPPSEKYGGWFPNDWLATNDRETDTLSDVLNYEHPQAQREYMDYVRTVAGRYKDNTTVAAWILGNEFAYFDLWESPTLYPSRRLLGFDSISLGSYRQFLAQRYANDISMLNRNWGSGYAGFTDIQMQKTYPCDRHDPGYHDLLQWRKQSIGDFIALGAKAVKQADPNHLITYSMVGGIFNGTESNNTYEDGPTIVERCAKAGYPLDFWSINNYAWALTGSELRSGDFGVTKYQEQLGLPVMLSETGFSSTENLFAGASVRQPKVLPGELWEALLSGAIGVHLFHWSDRDAFAGDFAREAGFGIVSQKRLPKPDVYQNTASMFRRMAEIRIENLLGGSRSPPEDIQLFWTGASDMGWARANQENAMVWGALRRLGYQPGLLDDKGFANEEYRGSAALLLSRAYQMDPKDLDAIRTRVLSEAGVYVHANGDLPGQFDAYHRPNPAWVVQMEAIFGLDVSGATGSGDFSTWDGFSCGGVNDFLKKITLKGANAYGPFDGHYSADHWAWRIWQGIKSTSGVTVLQHRGADNLGSSVPALHLNNLQSAKTAVTTIPIGDFASSANPFQDPRVGAWDIRSDILKTIYWHHFGIEPAIALTGAGSQYVMSDYRICRNGSVLIALLNEHINGTTFALRSALLDHKTIENLSSGGLLEKNPDGKLPVTLEGDGYLLLYLYDEIAGGPIQSLVNSSAEKVWIDFAPAIVWPNEDGYGVTVRYDTRGEARQLMAVLEGDQTYGVSGKTAVSGTGQLTLQVPVPDPDRGAPGYSSTRQGGQYRFRVLLLDGGTSVAETQIPVHLSHGIWVAAVPDDPRPGESLTIKVHWEDLPSFKPSTAGTPLSRARLWDSSQAGQEHYNIVLELRNSGGRLGAWTTVTGEETASHSFSASIPAGARGPFHWMAYAQTASGASSDIVGSFEGNPTGAAWPGPAPTPDFIHPWTMNTYTADPTDDDGRIYQNHGVGFGGTDGSQSMFAVVANPVDVGAWSGFFVGRVLDKPLALPVSKASRAAYRFSFDFAEKNRRACVLELQIKDVNGATALSGKTYEPGEDAWDSLSRTLDSFEVPPWSDPPDFDWSRVKEIIINIPMLEKGDDPLVQYVGFIDNIAFDGPETVQEGGTIFVTYRSDNDSLRDVDGDGLSDVYETATGRFVSPQNTGTDPARIDSDGDGQADGPEVVAGSDPNAPMDWFGILRVSAAGPDRITIVWRGVPGRRYGVMASANGAAFQIVPGYSYFTVETEREIEAHLPRPTGAGPMLFRVRAE
jgi:Beta-galactosidase